MTGERRIELEVEVEGTPEEVWEAIATGPGVSSWYVPHQIEEREGGAATARFGPGPEMEVGGRVAAWEPPNRVVFDGGDADEGFAFEWLVEARAGGTCIVRLVNSGFGTGDDWDAQYDAMNEGWQLFLRNLQLHLEHFPGQHGTASLPMGAATGSREEVWGSLTKALGIPAAPPVGQELMIGAGAAPDAAGTPVLAGTVVDVAPTRLTLLVDSPAKGTAFIAVEAVGDQTGVSIWSYLYGPGSAEVAAEQEQAWQTWLAGQTFVQ